PMIGTRAVQDRRFVRIAAGMRKMISHRRGRTPMLCAGTHLRRPPPGAPRGGRNRYARIMVSAHLSETVALLRAHFESGRTKPVPWRLAQLKGLDRMLKESGGELVE